MDPYSVIILDIQQLWDVDTGYKLTVINNKNRIMTRELVILDNCDDNTYHAHLYLKDNNDKKISEFYLSTLDDNEYKGVYYDDEIFEKIRSKLIGKIITNYSAENKCKSISDTHYTLEYLLKDYSIEEDSIKTYNLTFNFMITETSKWFEVRDK